MVFIFGMNFPLVESLFVIGILILISLFLIVWTLFALRKLNKKLDKIIKEERIVKQELDKALSEENDQIELLATLSGNVNAIKRIAEKKNKKIEKVEKEMAKVKKDAGKKKQNTKALEKAIEELEDVDKLSKEEENALKQIGKEVTKYAKKGVAIPGDMLNAMKSLVPTNTFRAIKRKMTSSSSKPASKKSTNKASKKTKSTKKRKH